ncbi:MerR family transcriptional regulator [Zavarzinia aquatilis]|uniref:MerR family transcriptional regulator n=1 Tax=Zavarzinia aquatilis TaxID=2211142 RepID=UPI001FAF64B8|nr:MerR family transcriptional regulator [Zavarzinia aquatilis]
MPGPAAGSEGAEARLARGPAKQPGAFRTISEVAQELDVPQHVLRFWETRFPQIKPMKRGGGRRYYRPEDVALLRGIRHLLYSDGYTIKGVQKVLRENGAAAVIAVAKPLAERLAEHRDHNPVVALPLPRPALAEEADEAGEAEDELVAADFEAEAPPMPEVASPTSESPHPGTAGAAAEPVEDVAYWRGLARELRRELLEIRAILAEKSKI